jgi:acetoin utilization deacetylase AcuC-like enzyme
MAASLRRASDAVGAPVGVILEGGYDLGALSRSMAAVMPVLVSGSTPGVEAVDAHPLAARALSRLEQWWSL